MFKITRDSAGRLVVICEGCGDTHRDAPHDRNTAWQRTHADEHRRQRPRNRAGKGAPASAGAKPALSDTPARGRPSDRVTYVETTTQKEPNDVRH